MSRARWGRAWRARSFPTRRSSDLGAEGVVAVVLERLSVQLARARGRDEPDVRSAGRVDGRVRGRHRELGDLRDGRARRRDLEATRADEVVLDVDAVLGRFDRRDALAVDRRVRPAVAVRTRLEVDQVQGVAAVERQVLDLLLADRCRDVGRRRLDGLLARRDGDGLAEAGLERDGQTVLLADVDLDALRNLRLEARGVGGNRIGAYRSLGE